eukprot:CAMPEP_0195052458 /NCGR_PEP_ID=MMETSP0448-20130528/1800_1 /TAXON_ID=66468 /ORGANISM="Heterocapsa triquestra, Strain CCMP 448" /LENGTH=38 /DNA_ID= /DNA_START= /DNA_END= /DNA_ORIENTATION=
MPQRLEGARGTSWRSIFEISDAREDNTKAGWSGEGGLK